MAKVGFIGVGNMGGPMARNLLQAGHAVKVHDLSEEAVNFLTQAGAENAGSIQGAAQGVDALVTMLPTGVEAREVFLANEAITTEYRPDRRIPEPPKVIVEVPPPPEAPAPPPPKEKEPIEKLEENLKPIETIPLKEDGAN